MKSGPRVAVVRLSGVIAASQRSGATLSDTVTGPLLERAFRRGKPDAVAIILNSPGGSPVQSSLIASRIRRLAEETKLEVHVFVEDVAASGGYWIACAGDKIWSDKASILGSIGVISAGFGFSEFIERHGIERRVHTAGESKSLLDPFRPEDPADVARLKAIQEEMHDVFISYVKSRRGALLNEDEKLFTGDVWLGQRATELGLIDGIAEPTRKMREIFGEKVRFMRYGQKRSLFQRLSSGLAEGALGALEQRLTWSRFGL